MTLVLISKDIELETRHQIYLMNNYLKKDLGCLDGADLDKIKKDQNPGFPEEWE